MIVPETTASRDVLAFAFGVVCAELERLDPENRQLATAVALAGMQRPEADIAAAQFDIMSDHDREQALRFRTADRNKEATMYANAPYTKPTASGVDKTSAPPIGVPAPITLHPQLRLEAARIAFSNGVDAAQTEMLARFLITGSFSA